MGNLPLSALVLLCESCDLGRQLSLLLHMNGSELFVKLRSIFTLKAGKLEPVFLLVCFIKAAEQQRQKALTTVKSMV